MKNHDFDDDLMDLQYPWSNPDYDSESCYGQPYWSRARQHCHSIEPRMKALLAKQPRRPINSDVSNEAFLA
jgi:hypothetical protein